MSNLLKDRSKKIVLGHPLSASLYAYFDQELNNGRYLKSSEYHRYYKTLFGKSYEYHMDITLALSLIYDDIIVPAADSLFPHYEKYQLNGEYYNREFGLYFNWSDDANRRFEIGPKIHQSLQDKKIKALLNGIPKHAHNQIIHEVYFELSMAQKFNAPLFTLGRRQQLAQRISELESQEPNLNNNSKVKLVSNYLDITGLLFTPMTVESFYYLKTEKDLREYSKSFIKIIENFNPNKNQNIRKQLLLLMKEAINKDSLNTKVSGYFSAGSKVLSIAGLVPPIGLAAGIGSITTDWTSAGIDLYNKKNKWYELAPQIQKKKSMKSIHDSLQNLE